MNTTTQLKPVEISKDTRDRLNGLYQVTSYAQNKYSEVLNAIGQSGLFLGLVEDFGERTEERTVQLLQAEEKIQAVLARNSIVDDDSANRFLDSIEPEMQKWAQKIAELNDRHAREREKLLSTFK